MADVFFQWVGRVCDQVVQHVGVTQATLEAEIELLRERLRTAQRPEKLEIQIKDLRGRADELSKEIAALQSTARDRAQTLIEKVERTLAENQQAELACRLSQAQELLPHIDFSEPPAMWEHLLETQSQVSQSRKALETVFTQAHAGTAAVSGKCQERDLLRNRLVKLQKESAELEHRLQANHDVPQVVLSSWRGLEPAQMERFMAALAQRIPEAQCEALWTIDLASYHELRRQPPGST